MRLRYVCIQIASTNSHVFPETTMSGLQNATVTRGDPWTRGSARQTGVQNRQRVPGSETRYSTIFYTAWVCSSIRVPQACPGSTCSCCRPACACPYKTQKYVSWKTGTRTRLTLGTQPHTDQTGPVGHPVERPRRAGRLQHTLALARDESPFPDTAPHRTAGVDDAALKSQVEHPAAMSGLCASALKDAIPMPTLLVAGLQPTQQVAARPRFGLSAARPRFGLTQ